MGRILLVSNLPPPVHGVSVFSELLYNDLSRRGLQVRFYRVGSRGRDTQFEVFRVGKFIRDSVALTRLTVEGLLARIFRRAIPTIYFTPSQGGLGVIRDFGVATLGRRLGLRVVAHLHGCGWLDAREKGGWQASLMLKALASCDRVICLGKRYASKMHQSTGLPCVGINNGMPAYLQRIERVPPKEGEVLRLLFLSNFIRSKGLWIAGEVAQALARDGIPVELRCAGNWRSEQDKADFVGRFSSELLTGTICIVGPVGQAQKVELLRSSHFLLLPTRYPLEGQPLTLIEAMSSSLIPLTTDQGGIPDLFEFPGGELLASGANDAANALAKLVLRLSRDKGMYARLSALCHSQYTQNLTFKSCSDKIVAELAGPDGLRGPRFPSNPSPAEPGGKVQEHVAL